MYVSTYIYMHSLTIGENSGHRRRERGYMRQFRARKHKGEMLQLHYNIKTEI